MASLPIHPFSIIQFKVVGVRLELIPVADGRQTGHTLDRSPVHHRAFDTRIFDIAIK